MSLQKVAEYFSKFGMQDQIIVLNQSSATVDLAAQALGVIPARIAKTLSFEGKDAGCILVVAAGDAKINNSAFKARFARKATMLSPVAVLEQTGHAVGGVCPFGIDNPLVSVYLDESLRRFETVFPACGSGNSAIELTIPQLEQYSGSSGWVDVCKAWREQE